MTTSNIDSDGFIVLFSYTHGVKKGYIDPEQERKLMKQPKKEHKTELEK